MGAEHESNTIETKHEVNSVGGKHPRVRGSDEERRSSPNPAGSGARVRVMGFLAGSPGHVKNPAEYHARARHGVPGTAGQFAQVRAAQCARARHGLLAARQFVQVRTQARVRASWAPSPHHEREDDEQTHTNESKPAALRGTV